MTIVDYLLVTWALVNVLFALCMLYPRRRN